MLNLDISIIIVSWNVKSFLKECLKSIRNKTQKSKYEIIIVDNASRDGTCDYVRNEYANIKLIENRKNLGFSVANNQGIKIAQGRYIILLNPDTKLVNNALDRITNFMEDHPEISMAGGQLLNKNGVSQSSVKNFPNPFRDFLYASGVTIIFRQIQNEIFFKILKSKEYFFEYKLINGYISGAFLIIRRQTIDAIGLFEEKYPLYFEETDYCYRVIEGGMKIAYFPHACTIHYGGASSERVFQNSIYKYYRSLFFYYKKFKRSGNLLKSRILVFIGSLIRILFLMPFYLDSIDSFKNHIRACLKIALVSLSYK